MAITAVDIVSEFGKYYRPEGQGVSDVTTQIFEKSETESIFMRRVTDQTVLRKSSAEVSSVLQAFQKQFTPKGNTEFKPRPIQLYKLKIDVAEYPDDIEESWLGFLADTKLSRKEWPFIKWWIEKLLVPKSQEDWEMNEIYKGVLVEPTPGVANASGANVNGIKFQINAAIDDGKISVTPTGALETDPKDFVTQVETFIKDIPTKYRNKLKSLNMNRDNELLFRVGMNEKYNVNYAQADLTKLRHHDITVRGLASMEGSDKLWTTFAENMAAGIRGAQNETVFEAENVDRQVKLYTDFWKGVGFWIPEWVFTNDVELNP